MSFCDGKFGTQCIPSQISDWESSTQLVFSTSPSSDWWASYKSLLEDFCLKHEIGETREAERYKFGDGGTLVSSIRVTAPVFVAGKKGRIVFSVVPSKHLPLLIGRDFLTPARVVVDMGEKTLRFGQASTIWS